MDVSILQNAGVDLFFLIGMNSMHTIFMDDNSGYSVITL